VFAFGVALPALGHGTSKQADQCSDYLGGEHSGRNGRHQANAFPWGVDPKNPCESYRARVITTNWNTGAAWGWWNHPNTTTYSGWYADWRRTLVRDPEGRPYVVCASGRGLDQASNGSTRAYGWASKCRYYQG